MLKVFGKDLLIYGLIASVSKFIGIFLIPIFSVNFTSGEYGSLDLIMTIISLAAVLGMVQLESAIARFYHEGKLIKRQLYISSGLWSVIAISIFIVALTFLTARPLCRLILNSEQYVSVLKLASINILLFNIFGYLLVVIRFERKHFIYAASVFIQFVSTFIVAVVLVIYFEYGIVSYFIGQIVGLTLGVLILLIGTYKRIIFRFNASLSMEMFRYSLPMVPAQMGKWVNTYASRIILGASFGVAALGIFTVALKIAAIFLLIDSAFKMSWSPFIFERLKMPNHKIIIKSLGGISTYVIVGVTIITILFAEELMFILSTPDYYDGVPLLKILITALALPILIQILGIGSSIAKFTSHITYAVIVAGIINLVVLFLLMPYLGITSGPVALLVGNLSMLAIRYYYAEKDYYINYNLKKILSAILVLILSLILLLIFEIHLLFKVCFFLFIVVLTTFNRHKILRSIKNIEEI